MGISNQRRRKHLSSIGCLEIRCPGASGEGPEPDPNLGFDMCWKWAGVCEHTNFANFVNVSLEVLRRCAPGSRRRRFLEDRLAEAFFLRRLVSLWPCTIRCCSHEDA